MRAWCGITTASLLFALVSAPGVAPAQDKWIALHKDELGVPVSLGVGGSFDFVAGVARRAPVWMQRAGLEWLHRLWRQPWRAQRIFTAVVAFPLAVIFGGSKSD